VVRFRRPTHLRQAPPFVLADIQAIRLSRPDEFLFGCEVTWQRPDGIAGSFSACGELSGLAELLRWLDRLQAFEPDICAFLLELPAGPGEHADWERPSRFA
jgi:hypothetical protein